MRFKFKKKGFIVLGNIKVIINLNWRDQMVTGYICLKVNSKSNYHVPSICHGFLKKKLYVVLLHLRAAQYQKG